MASICRAARGEEQRAARAR